MTYAALKTLHILSMVLLFGTGLGSAFYKWMADRSGNVAHIAVTNTQEIGPGKRQSVMKIDSDRFGRTGSRIDQSAIGGVQ